MPTSHAHPASRDNVVPAQALVLVDLQEDFFNDTELRRCRDDLAMECNLLIRRAGQAGCPVIVVRTVHAADRSTWALNMLDDGDGMTIDGTPGAATIAELDAADAIEVVKKRDSAFLGTDLDDVLLARGIGVFALAGVSTESCIAATATDAYARDFRVILADRATASVHEAMHHSVLSRLSWQYRQPILEPDEIEFRPAPS